MLRRLTTAALLGGAIVGLNTQASARPRPGVQVARPTAARRTFNLFAGAPQADYRPNRVQCGIQNNGTACVDPTGSPVNENGFWPAGSPDNYVFNSGLQIAGFVPGCKPGSSGCVSTPDSINFAWSGDTVGAFFFDPRGDQHHGEGITNIYDGKNADDVANWPSAGGISDTSLFAPVLLGRSTASQEDLWYRYWDGNTSLATGRHHTMGLLVDQRFMAWNFPTGNNDILYTIVRFINITSNRRADYDSLARYGYSTADIDEIFAIAQNFRSTSQAFYNVTIPDRGFTWSNLYASYAGDFDEGDAGRNYSMGNLIFNTVANYKADFSEPSWQFPSSIFTAPLLAGPGMAAIKYLAAPGGGGISMMGNTTNGGAFPDAQGVSRLWRNLSGNILASDNVTCDVPGTVGNNAQAQVRRQCFWANTPSDTRIFGASGPFSIAPGQAAQTAVALVFAGSVASAPAATPGVAGNAGLPAMDLTPYIGSTNGLQPWLPSGAAQPYAIDGTRLFNNQDTVKLVDRVMGLANYTADLNANGKIDQAEIIATPRSLLDKEKVAQTVYDNKFLLPFAPEAPTFFLVPGDEHVTIAWEKSPSEDNGNPFFAVASQPIVPCPGGVGLCPNALYDPNFRNFDVEGYRIWRGRTQADMQVIAQFDYAGTAMQDYTAEFYDPAQYGTQCAPEIGVTGSCPVTYALAGDGATWVTATPLAFPLAGTVQQVPAGGRVQLANGDILTLQLDTAVVGGASGYPALTDNGVPFAYQDNNVVNGVQYFYGVTAFSVNSLKSGPSSLQSPLVTKTTTPRAPSSNNQPAVVVTGMFGADGAQLDHTAGYPPIDGATGTFSGENPMPPANAASFTFLASVAEALPPGDVTARVDSVGPGTVSGISSPPTGYFTLSSDTLSIQFAVPLPVGSFSSDAAFKGGFSFAAALAPYDSARSAALGISRSFAANSRMPVVFSDTITSVAMHSNGVAMVEGRYLGASRTSRYLAHSRWFDEGGSEPADPTITWKPDKTHNAGQLTGVDSIENIQTYRQPSSGSAATDPQINVFERGYVYSSAAVWYPADFVVTWGAGGTITVRDTTHHTDLPFEPYTGIGWGFVSLANITAAGITAGDLDDGTRTASITKLQYHSLFSTMPVCSEYWGINCAPLANSATLSPVDFNDDDVADGNGVLLVINGEPFLMKMAALPAAGTKWHLRAFGGQGLSATCDVTFPTNNAAFTPPTDCSGYSWSPANSVREALAPGLTYKIRVTQAFSLATNSGDLSNIHTVPDPYYVTNSLENSVNNKILRFVNLPSQAIIRIYSSSGVLVRILTHNDVGGGSEEVWDLRNRNSQFVASGVYFYHVEAPDGKTKIGRFTVVSYAQ